MAIKLIIASSQQTYNLINAQAFCGTVAQFNQFNLHPTVGTVVTIML